MTERDDAEHRRTAARYCNDAADALENVEDRGLLDVVSIAGLRLLGEVLPEVE